MIDGDRLKQIDVVAAPVAAQVARLAAARPAQRRVRPIVVRPGGMGDLILAHVAMETIGLDPRSVDWIIEKRSEPWAEHAALPHLSYDRAPGGVLRRLGTGALVVNTEQRFGLSQALARGLTGRGGTLVCFSTSRAASTADIIVPYDWDREHETVAFARLFARAFALDGPQEGAVPVARSRAQPATTALVVALGGGHAPSRAYSARDWAEHLDRFATASDEPTRLVGGPGERELATELVDLLGSRVRYEPLDFDSVCAQIAGAEHVLTIDGGLVHVATFYGVATTVLFTSGRDHKWAPLGEGSAVVTRTDLACRPCTRFGQVPPCPFAYACRGLDGTIGAPVSLRAAITPG